MVLIKMIDFFIKLALTSISSTQMVKLLMQEQFLLNLPIKWKKGNSISAYLEVQALNDMFLLDKNITHTLVLHTIIMGSGFYHYLVTLQ